MKIQDAILISLADINKLANSEEVYNHIIKNSLYDFGSAETPRNTVSSRLGDFIRNGDSRVKRVKKEGGVYYYYLANNEANIPIDNIETSSIIPLKKSLSSKSYDERDLHKLLSSFLKSTGVYSKTIFHEQSNAGKDSNQIWTHPDMVGIRFLNLRKKASQNLLKSVNRLDTFKLSSFELKKEINTDTELKKAFFQTVSNSSWANYGYLVAFEISESLNEEMERLNQSFGIGIIKLNANPYLSKVLYQPRFNQLDFKTIDKLCNYNPDFESFIEQIEKLMTAEERYYKAIEKELNGICDNYFSNDSEAEKYCRDKNIPLDLSTGVVVDQL